MKRLKITSSVMHRCLLQFAVEGVTDIYMEQHSGYWSLFIAKFGKVYKSDFYIVFKEVHTMEQLEEEVDAFWAKFLEQVEDDK